LELDRRRRREGGRGDHRQDPAPFPDQAPDPAPFPANDGTPTPPADDQQSAVARPKRPGQVRGSVTGEAQRPSALRRRAGESPPPPHIGRRWTLEGRAREMASSGRVSGAMAHLSKSRRAARRKDAIADRMLGMGDHRPAVGRGRMMVVGTFDVCSNAAVNIDLSCFLFLYTL